MIYSVSGEMSIKGAGFAVIDAGGLGLKIFANERTLGALPGAGKSIKLFTHLHVREGGMELYGFLREEELNFFGLLISVSGVGPRLALSILQVADLKELAAAIKESRPDVLTRASGIGRRTAERVIVELRNKVVAEKSEAVVRRMETDADLLDTLAGLGYSRDQARAALGKVDEKIVNLEDRLKAALRILSKRG